MRRQLPPQPDGCNAKPSPHSLAPRLALVWRAAAGLVAADGQIGPLSAFLPHSLRERRWGIGCGVTLPLASRASCFLPTAYCLLPPAFCLLPSASCLLPPASCLLPPASCLLPPAYCLLPTAFCRLPCDRQSGPPAAPPERFNVKEFKRPNNWRDG